MSAIDPFSVSNFHQSKVDNHHQLTAVVVVISTVAWLAMLLFHGDPANSYSWSLFFAHPIDTMEGMNAPMSPDWWLYAQWFTGWLIMVVAMMLPPALPFLQSMQRLVKGLPGEGALVASAATAFITAWMLAGVAIVAIDSMLTSLVANIPCLVDQSTLVCGLAAILVGVYQLSPLKQSCLIACRSPNALMLIAWNDHRPWRSAINIGMRYALVCIGCCWTLMLLTLVVGAFVLPLMVVVSVIMLLERLLPSIRPLVPLQAALACAIGILLLLGSLPPGLDLGETGLSLHNHHMIGK